ncbi:AAA family ATPase [Endozoicomonas sp. ALB115]|uniref:AAA family ATPase n=1 Tax=Endozoicomonas sp. ALB115 TaxID=3403074 RepID=UPI003BB49BCA
MKNTHIRILLTGMDEPLLERGSAFLDAINEVSHRNVLLTSVDNMTTGMQSDDDILVHLLSTSRMDDLASLRGLSTVPMVLIASEGQPLTGQQAARLQQLPCSVVLPPPFDERALLAALDQIHDDLLLQRQRAMGSYVQRHPDSRVVLFTGAGSGAGVSLLTSCVARLLARHPAVDTRPVLLLDGDWRYGSQATLNNCQPAHDLQDLLTRLELDQTAMDSYRTDIAPHLALLGMAPDHLGSVGSAKSLGTLLTPIRQKAGITLADIPAWNSEFLASMIPEADHLVLVMNPDMDGVRRARLLLREALTRLSPDQVTVVANRVSRYTTIDQGTISKALDLEPVMVPADGRGVVRALEANRLPVDSDPRSSFSRALQPLLNSLLAESPVKSSSLLNNIRGWSTAFRSAH